MSKILLIFAEVLIEPLAFFLKSSYHTNSQENIGDYGRILLVLHKTDLPLLTLSSIINTVKKSREPRKGE